MSIKHGLLALLTEGPMYGAQLRQEFERRTGNTWPLNIGQVYTTLSRLERDNLVTRTGQSDAEGRWPYALTEVGRAFVGAWWQTPVEREAAPRSELAIKVALAVTAPRVDVSGLLQHQRMATLRHLQQLTREKRSVAEAELAQALVLDHLIFAAEAESRWLDHIEVRLTGHRPRPSSSPPAVEHPSPPPGSSAQPSSDRPTELEVTR